MIRDKEIEALNEQIEEHKNTIAELEQTIKRKDIYIKQLQKNIMTLEETISLAYAKLVQNRKTKKGESSNESLRGTHRQ